MTEDEVRQLLISECAAAGGQKAWANAHGLSPQYVNDVLRGKRVPGARAQAALGLDRKSVYERVG